MPFAEPEALGDLWRSSGLAEVEVSPIVIEASYEDFDDLWAPFPTGVGPAGAYAKSLDGERQERLRRGFHERPGSPGGPFTLSARAWCAVAST